MHEDENLSEIMKITNKIPKHNIDNIFQYYAKKIVIDLIFQKIHDDQVCCFGGFIRDMIAGYDFNEIKDIDVRCRSQYHVDIFIRTLKIYFILGIVKETKNKFTINISVDIGNEYFMEYVMNNRFTMELITDVFYGDVKNTMKNLGENLNLINIDMDIYCEKTTYWSDDYHNMNCDLDVNTLRSDCLLQDMDISDLRTFNPNCDINGTYNNAKRREFIVLSKIGNPIIDHSDIDYYMRAFTDDPCIDYRNKYGKKILKTIMKMQQRGWKCLNKPCNNENCVLSILRKPN